MVARRPVNVAAIVVAAVLLASCQWHTSRYDASNTGYNPNEGLLGVENAGTLYEAWSTASLGAGRTLSVPIVVGSTVFVASLYGASGTLAAFDARGLDGCTSGPRVCSPLWTSDAHFTQVFFANGLLFANGSGKLRAFDPDGVAGCSGTPKVCQPLWTAGSPVPGYESIFASAPDGTEIYGYLGISRDVYVFDANGNQGCGGAPKTCAPIRTYRTASACPVGANCSYAPSISVQGDMVVVAGTAKWPYEITLGYKAGFDRSGDRGCSGSPAICDPIWSDDGGDPGSYVALDGGVAYYATTSSGGDGHGGFTIYNDVAAFGADDGAAHWQASLQQGSVAAPLGIAVGDGWVHVATDDGVRTFADDAGGCTTNCQPHHRLPASGATTPPSAANGVVYVGTTTGLLAYAADGTAGCSGTPLVCAPLASVSVGSGTQGLAVASGNLYVSSVDGKLRAFTVA